MKTNFILTLALCLSTNAFANDNLQPQPTGRFYECEIKIERGENLKTLSNTSPARFKSEIYKSAGTEFAKTNEIIVGFKDKELSVFNFLDDLNLSDICVSIDTLKIDKYYFTLGFNTQNIDSIYDIIENSKLCDLQQNNYAYFNSQQNDWSQNPGYGEQYYLKKTQSSWYDINIEPAWSISTGDNVRVAVIDQGIMLSHEDLDDNLEPGYCCTDEESPNGNAGYYRLNHGTMVAGVIGMENNNLLGVGTAYDCTMIPLRIAKYNNSTDPEERPAWIADAFVKAVDLANADVINFSYGSAVKDEIIDKAIDYALANGRNGKGCVIVAAAGNFNTNVYYPASRPDVIAVGYTDQTGNRSTHIFDEATGSCYGEGLDLVAPGEYIYTTDMSTQAYIKVSGSSLSAPMVSGVAALILSIRPDLSYSDVANIIESTCHKIPKYTFGTKKENGTWNNEVGYGMLDAYEAIKKAVFYNTEILCPDVFCTRMNFNIKNLPIGAIASGFDFIMEDNLTISDIYIDLAIDGLDGTIENSENLSGLFTIKASLYYKGLSTIIEKEVYMDDGDNTIDGTVEQEGFYSGGKYTSGISHPIGGAADFNKVYCNHEVLFTLNKWDMIGRSVSCTNNRLSWTYNNSTNELRVVPTTAGTYIFKFKYSGDNDDVVKEKTLEFTAYEIKTDGGGSIIHSIENDNIMLKRDDNKSYYSTTNGITTSNWKIQITNLSTSAVVKQTEIKSELPVCIPIGDLPEGYYAAHITNGDNVINFKFNK